MRSDDRVTIERDSAGHQKPARRPLALRATRNLGRVLLATVLGTALIATLSPTVVSAAGPNIRIERINGQFIIQGWQFPANSTGTIVASVGCMKGPKPFYTNKTGYFWSTYYTFNYSGPATADARLGNARAYTQRQISGPGPVPAWKCPTTTPPSTPAPTTTTTRPPAPTTTTTRPPSAAGGTTTTTTTRPPTTPPPATPAGWKLAFSDDFNGSAVNQSVWGLYEGAGNQGHGVRRRDAVSVGNGELRITGRGNVGGGAALKQSRTYGKWEIRARTDKGNGYGHGILLWPSSERWPIDGELDISEVPNGSRNYSGTFTHWGANNRQITHREDGDFSQWHTYGVEWTPGKLVYFLDGRVIQTITSPREAIPTTPHFLALQLDVGAPGAFIPPRDASSPESVVMHVDYVRVWSPA